MGMGESVLPVKTQKLEILFLEIWPQIRFQKYKISFDQKGQK